MPKILKEKREEAIKLRLQGKSYNEIKRTLNLASKGTLSCWFKNIILPPASKRRLASNMALARERGLFRFNKKRTRMIINENRKIRMDARKAIPTLSSETLFLVGVALYWGEGFQSERTKHRLGIRFVNSNPYMIALFLRFLREILTVDEKKIKANIRIHPNIERRGTIKFWQKITKLPHDRFKTSYQISSASKLIRPKHSLPYGTIDVRVNNRKLFYLMKGYIDGLASQYENSRH